MWLLAGLLILMAIIVVCTAIYRLTQRTGKKPQRKSYASSTKQSKAATTKTTASKETKAARAADKDITNDDRQKALLHELLELDKAHEAGKLSKAVYEERRAKTKARLRALMSESEREKEHVGEGRTKQGKREKMRR